MASRTRRRPRPRVAAAPGGRPPWRGPPARPGRPWSGSRPVRTAPGNVPPGSVGPAGHPSRPSVPRAPRRRGGPARWGPLSPTSVCAEASSSRASRSARPSSGGPGVLGGLHGGFEASGLGVGGADRLAELPGLLGQRRMLGVGLVQAGQGDVRAALGSVSSAWCSANAKRRRSLRLGRQQPGVGLVDGGLDLDQRRLGRGSARGEPGTEHVSLPGDCGRRRGVRRPGPRPRFRSSTTATLRSSRTTAGRKSGPQSTSVDGVPRPGRQCRPADGSSAPGTPPSSSPARPRSSALRWSKAPTRGIQVGDRDGVGGRTERRRDSQLVPGLRPSAARPPNPAGRRRRSEAASRAGRAIAALQAERSGRPGARRWLPVPAGRPAPRARGRRCYPAHRGHLGLGGLVRGVQTGLPGAQTGDLRLQRGELATGRGRRAPRPRLGQRSAARSRPPPPRPAA